MRSYTTRPYHFVTVGGDVIKKNSQAGHASLLAQATLESEGEQHKRFIESFKDEKR